MIALAVLEAKELGLTSHVGLPTSDPSIEPIVDDVAQYMRLLVMKEDRITDEIRLMFLKWDERSEIWGEEN